MTAGEPHPQRCETCERYQEGSQWCAIMHERIANIEYELIKRVGCSSYYNSHSSAGPVPERKQQPPPDALAVLLESPSYPEGVTLKLCECGNDTFRFVETADFLPEYGTWEGDEVLRICTKCGENHGCLADMETGKSITRKALAALRSGEGV